MPNLTTLRPGLLVSLNTSIRGNVNYDKRDIEAEHLTGDGEKRAVWETTRVVQDPAEHDEAVKVRSKCRSLITGVCSSSSFGLLCPEALSGKLDDAIAEARDLADQFNARAKLSHIGVYVIAGRIARDDVEAVRAINSEIRDLMDSMERGLKNLDVKVVREAADKARSLGQMLSTEASAQVQNAIDAARSAARRIVKAGEAGAIEIDSRAIRAITTARTQFLDLDDDGREIGAPVAAGRAVDFEEGAYQAMSAAPRVSLPLFEME